MPISNYNVLKYIPGEVVCAIFVNEWKKINRASFLRLPVCCLFLSVDYTYTCI